MNTTRLTITALIALSLLSGGCALFVVGDAKNTVVVERSQRSAHGVVYLFKEELDSGNVQAATDLMVHSSGRRLLAVERYEIKDEVERWRRLMAAKPITAMQSDTLSATNYRVHVTMDYIKHFDFSAMLLDNVWYIASVQPVTAQRQQ
ncbi:MAG: hypothetical protein SGJ05_09680 [bacterium]|nr:hypothetical protein [bacterium]